MDIWCVVWCKISRSAQTDILRRSTAAGFCFPDLGKQLFFRRSSGLAAWVCTVIQLYWQAVRGTDNTTALDACEHVRRPRDRAHARFGHRRLSSIFTLQVRFDINSQRIFVLTVGTAAHRQNCVLHLESDEGTAPGARAR